MNYRGAIIGLILAGGLSSVGNAYAETLATYRMLTPETALELAQAALDSCRNKGFQVAVTVVDRMGVTQVILRDRYAGPHTPDTARRKAWTAVSFRTDTLSMSSATQAGEPQAGARFIPQTMMIGGGVPVEAGGSIVAGVGVSGAPDGQSDDSCAREGIEAIKVKLEL
jgi:uncharacterized protein GlcG (DUF336 family)